MRIRLRTTRFLAAARVEVLRDDQALDFGDAFVNLGDVSAAVVVLDRAFAGTAVAAVDLADFAGDASGWPFRWRRVWRWRRP